ncbi:MAG: adenylate/guanylate cyclase domain-containing protein, partial [bacterium]
DKGCVFELNKNITTIGRIFSNDIVVSDISVSRKHAIITKEKNTYIIKDQNSKNGIFVNDILVSKTSIKNGDRIRIGRIDFLFVEKQVEEVILSQERNVLEKSNTIIKSIEQTDVISIKKALSFQEKKLAILYQIGNDINFIFDLEKLLDRIVDFIFTVLNVDRVFLMLIDEKTNELIPQVVRYKNSKTSDKITISKTIVESCLKNKQSILTQDACKDPRFKEGASIAAFDIKSAMCVPLWIKGKIIGIIYVDTNIVTGVFKEEDLDLLTALSNQSSIIIENARLYENIQQEIRLRSNLQRYLSPSVVDKIIKEKGEISLGGEKKEVTILFADIRNFTSNVEKMDPTITMAILNEYFLEMTNLIFKYEGTVDKYIGDCLMAVFGAPFSHSNDTLRAVQCAIEMQKHLKIIKKDWMKEGKELFEIGIGINTGEVVAGNIGSMQRMEYTVIGDNVNIASRIEERALANQILISENTYEKIKKKIKVFKSESLILRGRSQVISLYEVKWLED